MVTGLRYRTLLSIWVLVAAGIAACGRHPADSNDLTARRSALLETPTFVQVGFATPQTPQASVAVTFDGAQAAGNFIAVLVGWSDTTAQVTSVSDTSGNIYQVAAGPTTRPGELTHVIYYAKNIAAAAAGANVVHVAFSQAAAYADVRVLEYSGVDRVAPLDVAVGATGNSATSASGSVATTNTNDLLIAGNVVMTLTSAAGSDFVARVVTTPDGSLAADRVVSATGSYGATASLTQAGAWIMQMAAFRAATSSDDTQPPSAATALAATAASSSQINLAWTAATDDVGVTGYLIERCQGAGCVSFAQVGTASGATYSDAGLAAATSYGYRVRARDAGGNMGGYSNTAAAMTATAPPAAPAYVQGSYAVPQTPQTTVAVTYAAAQVPGHLNVVVVGWSDSTAHVSSVSDSAGNVYALAVGPTVMSGTASQSIYYAKNIAAATAGANVVTVTFDQPANYADVRAVEYSGVDTTAPLDVVASGQGTGITSSTPAVTTTNAVDLLVAANLVSTGTIGAGSNFVLRLLTDPDGDIVEDRVVSAIGSYAATAPLTATATWIMQMVAFKAASQTAPPPDQCHNAGTCDPATGSCSYPAKPNGTPCDDGNACTEFDECNAGTCQGTRPYTCVTPDSCQEVGTCNPGKASPTPPLTEDLIAWWRLEGDGSDATGGGHTLDEGGAVRAPGRVGFGMKFDGSSCMSAPIWDDARMQNTSGLTVMAWINANDPAGCPYPDQYGQRAVLGRGYDYSVGAMCMFPSPGPGVTGAVRPVGAQTWGWGGAWGAAQPDQWVHVAITWDRQGTTTYYNGRGIGYTPVVGDITDWEPQFTIGCITSVFHFGNEHWRHFVGTVDEAMLYGRALSPQEIWSYYSAADPCAPHQHLPDNTACHDGDLCTLGDRCQSGTCTATSPPITCTPFDSCHEAPPCISWAGCHPHTPAPAKPDGAACNDSNACTQTDICQGGSCTGGNPVACNPTDACHLPGTCSAASGVCSNPLNHDMPCASSNADILGFEDPGRWAASSGTTFLVQQRTQGSAAIAIASPVNATIVSDVLTSNGPELFGIAQPTSFLVDLFLPQQNPLAFGSLDMFVTSVSHDVHNESLGHHDLADATLGQYSTWEFAFPSSITQKLNAAPFNDLRVTIVLNVPFDGTGQYSFDNLRLKGPVRPVFECVTALQDGGYRALFGYENVSTTTYHQPIGLGNRTTPDPADRGQPTTFSPGMHSNVFSADFTGTFVTWDVRGQAVTATSSGPPCNVPPPTLTPIVECVSHLGGNQYRAIFGYDNGTGKQVTIPVSSENKMLPLLINPFPFELTFDRGQVTTFKTGRHRNVFSVDYTDDDLEWRLAGSGATASASSPACPPPPGVQPILEGILPLGGNRFKAFFGYQNNTGATIEIEVGAYNKFMPGAPVSAGQTTIFAPGRQFLAFAVESDGQPLTWQLSGSEQTATVQSGLLAGNSTTLAQSVPTRIDVCHEILNRLFVPARYEDVPDCRSTDWELCVVTPDCCFPKPICSANPLCLVFRLVQTATETWLEDIRLVCEFSNWKEELSKFLLGLVPLQNAIIDPFLAYIDAVKLVADPIPGPVRAILTDLISEEVADQTADRDGFTLLDIEIATIVSGDDPEGAFFEMFVNEATNHGVTLDTLVVMTVRDEFDGIFDASAGYPTPTQFRQGLGSSRLRAGIDTLVHELVHVRQYRNAGPTAFVDQYLAEIIRHGYGNGSLEDEANAYEARVGTRY